VKRDSAEINRVVNSTLRNSQVGRYTAALEASRFAAHLKMTAFWLYLKFMGDALSRRGAQAIGPVV
jgi:hypothetical protein